MLKVQEIRELIRLVDQSSIDEFELQNEGLKLVLKKNHLIDSKPVEVTVQSPVEVPATPQQVVAAAPQKEAVSEAVKQEPSNNEKRQADMDANLHKITSPMVGTFYQSPSPDADPYVSVGSKVQKNSVVCIVEAMKLFNEIEAEVNGEIVEILVENGQLVEFGQPLFLVKAN